MEQQPNSSSKGRRGFAGMSSEKQREIARMGGQAAHKQGVAHKWNSEEARQAGKKGGQVKKRDYWDQQGKADLIEE